jgi:elongation factor Tu
VSNYTPQFFFRTANVTGTIILDESQGVSVALPGESLSVKVKLVEQIALNIGLRFVMREGNITIGAGVITKLCVK